MESERLLRLLDVVGACVEKATEKHALLEGEGAVGTVEEGIAAGETKFARRVLEILNVDYSYWTEKK